MEHKFFYVMIGLVIIIILCAPRGNVGTIQKKAIGAGGLNSEDARFPFGYSMSAPGITAEYRRKWGVTSF